jgi:SHS2 domain-containing protein
MAYRVLSHTADTGIEATAASLAMLVEALAAGMFDLMSHIDPCPGEREATVAVSADTQEDLVVDALSELLFRSEVDDIVFCEFSAAQAGPTALTITARGVDARGLSLDGPPIKAVTYHDLVVRSEDESWYGRVYFDV